MTNLAKSLYIHIPFCEHLCDYCDFTKLQYFRVYAETYISNLIEEIESFDIKHQLDTIYVGGGTPTSLEDDLFEKLFRYLSKYSTNIKEFTVEANPESLSLRKLQIMKENGVNRLSIGVESTNDKILKSINRNHTFNDVIKANELARSVGFNNISFDLILGLPHVSLKMLEVDINNILSLAPEHISCYSLTVHKHTKFYLDKIKEPSESYIRDAYDMLHKILNEHGYRHYEISNWCKSDLRSLHNLTYWRNETYYGAGLGASGYISNLRYKNTVNILDYNNKVRMCEKEYLNNNDQKVYEIILNLRLDEGLSLDKFKNLYYVDLYETHKNVIDELINDKLIYINKENNALICTYEGFMILDTIILKLF